MGEKKEFVVKSNDIIRDFKYDYNEREYKLIAYICSVYKEHEAEVDSIETFRFSVLLKDVARICGFCDCDIISGQIYSEIRKLFKTLEKKSDWIPVFNKDGKEFTTSVSWISKAYFEKRDRVEFYADRDLYWYICDLKERFTQYELRRYMTLNSKYSLRLYELFKSYEYCKSYQVAIDDLKSLLCVDKKAKYNDNSHFLELIVRPAIKEINEKMDLKIDLSVIKTGRSISDLFFEIGKGKKKTA